MSKIAFLPPKPITRREDNADKQAFAQVEKWMEMIREISGSRKES